MGSFPLTASAVIGPPVVFGASAAAHASALQIVAPGAVQTGPALDAYAGGGFSIGPRGFDAIDADIGGVNGLPYSLASGRANGFSACAVFIFPASNACSRLDSGAVPHLFETDADPTASATTSAIDTASVVPEPKAVALLALGLAAVVLPGRRRAR